MVSQLLSDLIDVLANTYWKERMLVSKDNSREYQEPDDSMALAGADMPFLVFEVRDSQSKKELKRKVRIWTRYSNSTVRILEIESQFEETYCVLASVLKVERRSEPTPDKPERFVHKTLRAIRRVNISSRESQDTFTIDEGEIRSQNAMRNPTDANSVTISLGTFFPTARQVVSEKKAEKERKKKENGPNRRQYDPNQSSASTSATSSFDEKEEDTDSDYSDHSEDGDLDYEP